MAGYYPIIGAASEDSRYIFGPDFFRRRFHDYIRQYCNIHDANTSVLEIVLGNGSSLDVSHIEEISDNYMLVAAFLDTRTCEDTYHTYIRYDTIFRINIVAKPASTRPVGFNPNYETTYITRAAVAEAEKSDAGAAPSDDAQ